jgi:prophage regulatory protein
MSNSIENASDHLLHIKTVMAITTISRASLYRMLGRGEFPQSVRISRGRVAWRSSDVQKFMREGIQAA